MLFHILLFPSYTGWLQISGRFWRVRQFPCSIHKADILNTKPFPARCNLWYFRYSLLELTESMRYAVTSIGRDMVRPEWVETAYRWAVLVWKEESTVNISDLTCKHLTCGSLFCSKLYIYRVLRRKGPNFGRVFLMLNYTDITQNIYVQSWTVSEIMASEVLNFDSCYTLIDYQIHIENGRNMWFL